MHDDLTMIENPSCCLSAPASWICEKELQHDVHTKYHINQSIDDKETYMVRLCKADLERCDKRNVYECNSCQAVPSTKPRGLSWIDDIAGLLQAAIFHSNACVTLLET